jgi:hypothetical protein
VPAAVCNHPAGWTPRGTRPEPTVRAQLLARVDDLTGRMAGLLGKIRPVCEQLEPDRAFSCRNAITMASVMVDDIWLGLMPARSTSQSRETVRRRLQSWWCRGHAAALELPALTAS